MGFPSCETVLTLLLNPWTYVGIIGTGLTLGLLYKYSQFTFLTRLTALLRLSSLLNFSWNILKSTYTLGLLKFAAIYTTFHQTITLALNGGRLEQIIATLGSELWSKIVLAAKNVVGGINILVKWLGSSKTVCGLYYQQNFLWEALVLLWTGLAAYIFVIWLWKKTWYTWRGEMMEQQQVILLVVAVTSLSLAVHELDLANMIVETGKSLLDTLGQQSWKPVENQTKFNGSS